MNVNGSQETVAVWLRMLDAVEAGARSNKESIEVAAVALSKANEQTSEATESLSKAVEALSVHSSNIEETVELKMSVKRLQGEIIVLQDESKSQKVGKGDLLWKVLVGVFALVATGLGTALISMLINKS
jgi:predicted  nucleic acid-binding Zn-ribbon protein